MGIITELTAFGLADRLLEKNKGKVFYVIEQNSWICWNGKQFVPARIEVEDLVRQVIIDLEKELIPPNVSQINKDKYGILISNKEILDFQRSYSNFSGISSILLSARSLPEMTAYSSVFDNDPNKLNVQNCIVDLKTGDKIDHSPEFKMQKIANAAYVPGAQSEKWDKFLDEITCGDHELKEYLQRIIGYSLTGSTNEQVFFIFVGNGANGKSTFLNLFSNILGDYAKVTPTKTLMKGYQGINTDEARLNGARFVVASEANKGQKLDEAKIKKMTGGDTITARYLRKDFVEFQAEFKLFMAVNTLPEVSADDAIFRRILVVPFDARFQGKILNKDLQKELLEESEAIFAWAVEGVVKWYKEGLPHCQKVEDAIKVYQESADILDRFISTILTKDPKSKISISELYDTYEAWAKENAERSLTKRELGQLMYAKGFEQKKSGSVRAWEGLDLKTRVTTKNN